MNTFAAVVMVLAASYSTTQVSSFGFRAADFTRDYLPFLATCMAEGQHKAVFQPYSVQFAAEGKSYFLWVSSGWLKNFPIITLRDEAPWYGNSAKISYHASATTTDYTVCYNASVGTVKDNNYESTECYITATNKGYIPATTNVMVKDYAGSDYVFLYPADKWFLTVHTIDADQFGTWDISASCPGADSHLASALVDTVKKVDLPKQRDVARDIVRACSDVIFDKIDAANYITK